MRKTGWFKSVLLAGVLSGPQMLVRAAPAAVPQTQASQSDQMFLKQALGVNEEEVQLGRLAAERAGTPKVKAMGEKMVQNHTRLGKQLSDLAGKLGVSGTAELSPDQRDTLARVRARSGADFDAAFKQTVDDGHVKELAMYRGELSLTGNPQLRALAETRVEALEKSLREGQVAK